MQSLKRSRTVSISPNKMSGKQQDSPSKKLKTSSSTISPRKDIKPKEISERSPQKDAIKMNIEEEHDENDFQKWFDDDDDYDEMCSIAMNDENLPNNSQESKNTLEPLLDELNLNQWTRCLVQKIERDLKNYNLILDLKEENSKKFGICRLQGPWSHIKIKEQELICIKGVWNDSYNCYVVNGNDGLIVTNPDYLISGTSIVGSLFCARREVLQNNFRGLDADNKLMVIGSVIHELLQVVLTKKLTTLQQIENYVEEFLKSKQMVFTLYASKMTAEELKCEIEKFLPNIVNFIDQYVEQKGSVTFTKDMFQGCIDKIEDIEENLLIPQLGLKGKIDVSVMARKRQNSLKFEQKYMPLELKTGRATFSSEHKGQLILYQMMLKEVNKKIDSGLLLYLRDGIMKEIPSTRNEERDLIILRNELAYYLTRYIKPKDISTIDTNTNSFTFEPFELPEPINHHNACSKCPYQTICSTFIKTNDTYQLNDKNPLKLISKKCTEHLTNSDLQYFIHWCGLLSLENQEIHKSSNFIKNLWLQKPEERYKQGKAIINLKIYKNVECYQEKYLHVFEMKDDDEEKNDETDDELITTTGKNSNFMLFGINIGDYVTVSTRQRIGITNGLVHDLNKNSIILILERNLQQNYTNEIFIIDKLESQTMNVFNYTNLGILLDNSENINKLRKIIIEKEIPTFSKNLPKTLCGVNETNILKELNKGQREAVIKALTANEYMLIKGLPGTGKTQTLVAIIRLLYSMEKTILITSHTHSAVDNILVRLLNYNIPFLRLGSCSRISKKLHENSDSYLIQYCKTPEQLHKLYTKYKIIGVTCLGLSHSLFLHRKFDICIIDEATQIFQPTLLRSLYYSNKFILVGDSEQLPPVIRSRDAKYLGAEETLFDRLDSKYSTSILKYQYRMNKNITKLANDLTYNGNLYCANDTIMKSNLNIPQKQILLKYYSNDKWILRTLGTHIDQSVCFLDTKNCLQKHLQFQNVNGKKNNIQKDLQLIEERFKENNEKNDASSSMSQKLNYTNYCEIAIIFYLIEALLKSGYKSENIGIIASYRAQVELIRKFSEDYQNFHKIAVVEDNILIDFQDLEVNTVDQYQGRDKEIIFYSCTRTGHNDTSKNSDGSIERKKEIEILEDHRRLTVAITRAKYKLIILGDEKCLQKYTPFKILSLKIPKICKIILEDSKYGFSWDRVMDKLKSVMLMRKN